MSEIIRKIIENVLVALYRPFGFAIVLTVLFMFLYMYAEEYGWKNVVQCLVNKLKTRKDFRVIFLLVFYIAMILFRTLMNRSLSENPLNDVIGIWGLKNSYGELTTEVIENLILFIPFTILMLCGFGEKIVGKSMKIFVTVWKTVKIVFLFSLLIEFLQLFLRLGTFQLSDLFYNTLGGLIGGLIYWCGYKITHRNKKEK